MEATCIMTLVMVIPFQIEDRLHKYQTADLAPPFQEEISVREPVLAKTPNS